MTTRFNDVDNVKNLTTLNDQYNNFIGDASCLFIFFTF